MIITSDSKDKKDATSVKINIVYFRKFATKMSMVFLSLECLHNKLDEAVFYMFKSFYGAVYV